MTEASTRSSASNRQSITSLIDWKRDGDIHPYLSIHILLVTSHKGPDPRKDAGDGLLQLLLSPLVRLCAGMKNTVKGMK